MKLKNQKYFLGGLCARHICIPSYALPHADDQYFRRGGIQPSFEHIFDVTSYTQVPE